MHDDLDTIKTIGEILSLDLPDEYNIDAIYDYLKNIREYNEKNEIKKYKEQLKNENSLDKKIELARKALEFKMRREDENE